MLLLRIHVSLTYSHMSINTNVLQRYSDHTLDTIKHLNIKDGLSLKTKYLNIHLYAIATQYKVRNNTLVEYIDNQIISYNLVIKYRN